MIFLFYDTATTEIYTHGLALSLHDALPIFDLFEGPHQEMGAAHPGLESPERMLDGLPADGHSLRHSVEPGLHLVEHPLVFPAFHALDLVECASGFERAGRTGREVAVVIDRVPPKIGRA